MSRMLQFGDVCLSMFVFTPLVVLFWHGMIGVLDKAIINDQPVTGSYIILSVSIVLQIILSSLQTTITHFVSQRSYSNQPRFMALYNVILAMIQIMQYRGLKELYEYNIGTDFNNAITVACTIIVIMFSIRVCSQVTDMPFTLSLDSDIPVTEGFYIGSYFQSNPSLSFGHLLDASVTIAVIQSLVVLFNIAFWKTIYNMFYPADPLHAISKSLLLGHSLALVLMYLVPYCLDIFKTAVNSGTAFIGFILIDLLSITQGLSSVMTWHGYFKLYEIHKRDYQSLVQFGYDFAAFYEVLLATTLLVILKITCVLVRQGISPDKRNNYVSSFNFKPNYLARVFNGRVSSDVRIVIT